MTSVEVAVLPHGSEPFRATQYYMVGDFDLEQLTGPNQIPGHFDVGFTGGWISRRMVVSQYEAGGGNGDGRPEYVQR